MSLFNLKVFWQMVVKNYDQITYKKITFIGQMKNIYVTESVFVNKNVPMLEYPYVRLQQQQGYTLQ